MLILEDPIQRASKKKKTLMLAYPRYWTNYSFFKIVSIMLMYADPLKGLQIMFDTHQTKMF